MNLRDGSIPYIQLQALWDETLRIYSKPSMIQEELNSIKSEVPIKKVEDLQKQEVIF